MELTFPNDPWFAEQTARHGGIFDRPSYEAALSYVTDWRRAVDGGAHVGTWTVALSEKFDTVHAFEPDPDNYKCLEANTKHLRKIVRHDVALGAGWGAAAMVKGSENSGQAHLGTEGPAVKIAPLDDYGFTSLGFLKLDVEGYELHAILGARDTIMRCKPIILIEENGLCERYGTRDGDAPDLLKTMGMVKLAQVNKDHIFGW